MSFPFNSADIEVKNRKKMIVCRNVIKTVRLWDGATDNK